MITIKEMLTITKYNFFSYGSIVLLHAFVMWNLVSSADLLLSVICVQGLMPLRASDEAN